MRVTGSLMRWVEIDHGAIAHNVRALQRSLGESRLWAVVKGEGYGHDAVRVARTCMGAGAQGLAVSALSEGIALREAGIKAPIFVMNPVLPEQARLYIEYDIIASVENEAGAQALAKANDKGRPWPVHVKVDTGLGRFGLLGQVVSFVRQLHTFSGLEVQGIFSHFASADEEDQRSALAQWQRFRELLTELARHNVRPPIAHIANSAATLALPETRLQMARNGLSVYGMYPSPYVKTKAEARGIYLQPALSLKAKIASVRRLPAGSAIGYGSTYVTDKETTIATLPIGYSDGVSRMLSGKLEVLVQGQRRPVRGRICMNHCIVDVTGLDVQPRDTVTLLGQDGEDSIAPEEWATLLGTIAYEIVCMVGSRNRRIHLNEQLNEQTA